eukprot:552769-Pyramimonas_sp.AAC.1
MGSYVVKEVTTSGVWEGVARKGWPGQDEDSQRPPDRSARFRSQISKDLTFQCVATEGPTPSPRILLRPGFVFEKAEGEKKH